MTVDGNQEGAPNYFPNSFMGPLEDKNAEITPVQVNEYFCHCAGWSLFCTTYSFRLQETWRGTTQPMTTTSPSAEPFSEKSWVRRKDRGSSTTLLLICATLKSFCRHTIFHFVDAEEHFKTWFYCRNVQWKTLVMLTSSSVKCWAHVWNFMQKARWKNPPAKCRLFFCTSCHKYGYKVFGITYYGTLVDVRCKIFPYM